MLENKNNHSHTRHTFWQTLRTQSRLERRPFFAIAPMADVTDAPFRQLIAKYSRHGLQGGGPDVFWTEFVSANGLGSAGRDVLKYDLLYTEAERPIVAQLFTREPERMYDAVRLVIDLGFDGVDINMGCPDKTIEKQGAGAGMIRDKASALAVIASARQSITDSGKEIALSVKTRLGYNADELDEWVGELLRTDIDALTVHARTRKEMSKVPARWERVKDVVRMRDTINPHIVIIGNGDVFDIEDGLAKAKQSGCDGVMVGRALFGNPWFFDRDLELSQKGSYRLSFWKSCILKILSLVGCSNLSNKLKSRWLGDRRYSISRVSDRDRLLVLKEHILLFDTILGKYLVSTTGADGRTIQKVVLGKNFAVMKKHFKAYTSGMEKAKEIRMKLMEIKTSEEAVRVLEEYL